MKVRERPRRTSPAVKRAVNEAVRFLESDGAHVESFEPPDVEEAWGKRGIFVPAFATKVTRVLQKQGFVATVGGCLQKNPIAALAQDFAGVWHHFWPK